MHTVGVRLLLGGVTGLLGGGFGQSQAGLRQVSRAARAWRALVESLPEFQGVSCPLFLGGQPIKPKGA